MSQVDHIIILKHWLEPCEPFGNINQRRPAGHILLKPLPGGGGG